MTLLARIPGGLDIWGDPGAVPRLARNPEAMARVEAAVQAMPTCHDLFCGDARRIAIWPPACVHAVVTSPPYLDIKSYEDVRGQLGRVSGFTDFVAELETVWSACYRLLVPRGTLAIVVGDVCRSRRRHGHHHVLPLHAAITMSCLDVGFAPLTPLIWSKVTNARREASGRGGVLGRPYEPGGVVKTDTEFVVMARRPGCYRHPSDAQRLFSILPVDAHHAFYRQVWADVPGASTRGHPAPFPEQIAERLIRMFSFVGDTVLDPFMGSGTTAVAAARWGRDSVGVDVVPEYVEVASHRVLAAAAPGTVVSLEPEVW